MKGKLTSPFSLSFFHFNRISRKAMLSEITSVYEFSDFSHRTMWVYQRLRCSTNKKVVDTVVDNLEQQVVMVLARTAIAD